MEPPYRGVPPTGQTQIRAATNLLMMALQQGGRGHPNDALGTTLMRLYDRGLLPAVMYQLKDQRPALYEALKATPVMQAIVPQENTRNARMLEELIRNVPEEMISVNPATGRPKVKVQGIRRNPEDIGIEVE